MKWRVLYVHPRCEKKIAEYCKISALDYYLPLRKQTKIYQRRKVTFEKPVFPGYIFASFDEEGRLALLKSNNIIRTLEPASEEQLLFELDQIKKALMVDPSLVPCEALKKGRKVRIQSGPFMGIEGVVAEVKGTAKVRLNVEMIGQAIAVEVEKDFLELIE